MQYTQSVLPMKKDTIHNKWLHAPSMGITAHTPPLYAMRVYTRLWGCSGLVVIHISVPSQPQHVGMAQPDQQWYYIKAPALSGRTMHRALFGCTWFLVQALHQDRTGTMTRVHSTFSSPFPVESHKLGITMQALGRITNTEQTPADRTGD